MTGVYKIFGSELSPYSVKVRSYARYKDLPRAWTLRNAANQAEFAAHAKLPLVPMVITPEGEALQDSTPILETLEARHPEPALQPADPALAFLSALIEEYADEWGNKWMFHYRWTFEADQLSAAWRIAAGILGPDAAHAQIAETAAAIRARMVPRLSFVGSSAKTAPLIEKSFRRVLEIAEAHLRNRPYLFGARPCLADFGFFAQLYEMSTDPTPQGLMQYFHHVTAYTARMIAPVALGPFERWEALEPTLGPLFSEEIGARFLPWSAANAAALKSGAAEFSVALAGGEFAQAVQKYHARSLAEIKAKAARALAAAPQLSGLLQRYGCLDTLTAA